MSGPENQTEFIDPRIIEQAEAHISHIRDALERTMDQKNPPADANPEELVVLAEEARNLVNLHGPYASHKFRIKVSVPAHIYAETSRTHITVERDVKEFVASDVWNINEQEAVFYDVPSNLWLVVKGHEVGLEPEFNV